MIPSETQLRSWSEEKLKKRQLVQIIASRHGKIHLSEIHFVFSEMDGDKMNAKSSDSGSHYPMIPGVLRISPNKVYLDGANIGQTFTVRLPITNHTNACLARIKPGAIEMKAHNVFAELISHPTLLAPKMCSVCVLQVCGIGGDGKVELSFMGKTLCVVYLHGEKLKHYVR